MSKLTEFYTMKSHLFTEGQGDEAKWDEFEDKLIREELLPEIMSLIKPTLSQVKSPLSININYDPNGNLAVTVTRNCIQASVPVEPANNASEEEIEEPAIASEPSIAVEEQSEADDGSEDMPIEETPHAKRGARKKFKVYLNDKEVPGKDGAHILTEFIRLIGFHRVADMKIMCGKKNERFNLVDHRKRTDVNPKTGKPQKWQEECDGWYVYTNLTNPDKIKWSEYIAKKSKNKVQIEMRNENVEDNEQIDNNLSAPIVDTSVRGRFKQWAEGQLDRSTVSNYMKKLDEDITEWVRTELEPEFESIFDYTNVEEVQVYLDLLKASDSFMQENIRMHNSMTAAIGKYKKFLLENNS